MARQTIDITVTPVVDVDQVVWTISSSRPQIDSDLTPMNTDRYLARVTLPRTSLGAFSIIFDDAASGLETAGADLSTTFETQGSLIIRASDGMSVTILMSEIADMTNPYQAAPNELSNVTAVRALGEHITGLTDQSLTVTISDGTISVNLFERVNGSYELVTPYERVSGSYEEITAIFERVSGSYVE